MASNSMLLCHCTICTILKFTMLRVIYTFRNCLNCLELKVFCFCLFYFFFHLPDLMFIASSFLVLFNHASLLLCFLPVSCKNVNFSFRSTKYLPIYHSITYLSSFIYLSILRICIYFNPHCFPSFRSNLMGTKFTVYDSGSNPSKTPGALLEESNTRQELAAVCYVSVPETKMH